MIKKLLLQMLPPEPASRETIETIRADQLQSWQLEYNDAFYWRFGRDWIPRREIRYRYKVQAVIEAETCDQILRLSIYSRYDIHRGSLLPEVVTYFSKSEERWLNYFPATGKWTTAMLGTVVDVRVDRKTNDGSSYVLVRQVMSVGKEKAEDFFGREGDSVFDIAYSWQQKLKQRENAKIRQNQLRKWEKAMELIPPLPDDFKAWSMHEGLRAHNYIFRQVIPKYNMRRTWIGKYRYTCSYCESMWESNDPGRHNEEYECPYCDTKVQMKYWGRQKSLDCEEWTGIVQKYRSGYVFRKFLIIEKRNRDTDYIPRRTFAEIRRVITDAEFNPITCYEEDDLRKVGRCWNPKTVGSCWYKERYIKEYGRAVMYTANLQEVMTGQDKWLTKLGEQGSLFFPEEGEETSPVDVLHKMKEYAFVEYVERAGMTNLAREIFYGQKAGELDAKAGRMTDLLKISGDAVARIKRLDIGWDGYQALRYIEEHGEKMSDDTLQLIDRRKIKARAESLCMHRTGLTLQQTVLYITKMARRLHKSFDQTRNRYKDYLDLAEERGMDLHDDIVRRSTKMDELHDRWSDEKQARKDAQRVKTVDRKYKTIARDCIANQAHFDYKSAGLCIIVPQKASDLITEGRTLHHCVGATESYMSKMNSHKTFILFLRRVGEENSPYYTLEVEWNGRILQAYSEFDRKPDYDNKIGPWLQRFQKAIQKRIAKENAQQIMQEAI